MSPKRHGSLTDHELEVVYSKDRSVLPVLLLSCRIWVALAQPQECLRANFVPFALISISLTSSEIQWSHIKPSHSHIMASNSLSGSYFTFNVYSCTHLRSPGTVNPPQTAALLIRGLPLLSTRVSSPFLIPPKLPTSSVMAKLKSSKGF